MDTTRSTLANEQTNWGTATPTWLLFPFRLLVPHRGDNEVLVFEVVHRNRLRVREDLAAIRQPEFRCSNDTARMLQYPVAQRRHKQVERQVGDRDDRAVEFPLRFGRLVRELYAQRDRVLQAGGEWEGWNNVQPSRRCCKEKTAI